MNKQTRKVLRILGLMGGIFFLIFICYIFIFVMWRPFMGEITQDKPIMKKLCTMQAACQTGVALYQCYSEKQDKYIQNENLIQWEGYYGCNKSTAGFYERDDGYKGIYVEGCGCGGLN
jgi:hypothetical protein